MDSLLFSAPFSKGAFGVFFGWALPTLLFLLNVCGSVGRASSLVMSRSPKFESGHGSKRRHLSKCRCLLYILFLAATYAAKSPTIGRGLLIAGYALRFLPTRAAPSRGHAHDRQPQRHTGIAGSGLVGILTGFCGLLRLRGLFQHPSSSGPAWPRRPAESGSSPPAPSGHRSEHHKHHGQP